MLDLKPFNSIIDLLKKFPDEQSCIDHLEKIIWQGNVVSPFDSTSKVYKCKNNRYKCKNSGKYFTIKTGSLFEGTKIPLQQWFLAIYLFSFNKKGISSYQLAKDLNISQKSAWLMLSKLRYAVSDPSFIEAMTGDIEVDETFVGGKNKNRHWDKKVEHSQGRSFKEKVPVFGMFNRETKKINCVVVPDTSKGSLHPVIYSMISKGSTIISDEWLGYNNLNKHYSREIVNHKIKEYVNENGATTNRVENCWTHLKRMWVSTYSGRITKKHLQKYANEFAFRRNHNDESTNNTFNLLLSKSNNKKLTYFELTK